MISKQFINEVWENAEKLESLHKQISDSYYVHPSYQDPKIKVCDEIRGVIITLKSLAVRAERIIKGGKLWPGMKRE
jgi:hypothetical protein